jgi:hypothetical protein
MNEQLQACFKLYEKWFPQATMYDFMAAVDPDGLYMSSCAGAFLGIFFLGIFSLRCF